MALAPNIADDAERHDLPAAFRTSVAKLRESLATRARALPLARHAWARYRRHLVDASLDFFLTANRYA